MNGRLLIYLSGVVLVGTAIYYYYKKSKEVVLEKVGNFEIVKNEE
jgi:hypothetical protein